MENSEIAWTDNTFNPWEGCAKISPECDNCYASRRDTWIHKGAHWGANAGRRQMSHAYWQKPFKWDRDAQQAGIRSKVFCGSLCDWADNKAPAGARDSLFDLIDQTEYLDWLLLTKRAGNITSYLPDGWYNGWENVWLGVTAGDRDHGLDRIDTLRRIPAKVRFLSMGPLLEDMGVLDLTGIHWVIVGGESGPGARTMDLKWAHAIRNQCFEQNTAFFFKQMSEHDRKEDFRDFYRFPVGLQIRQFPGARHD